MNTIYIQHICKYNNNPSQQNMASSIRTMNIPLIFVRHGQSEGNAKRVCSTKEQKLTEKGIEQAEKLGKYLHDNKAKFHFDHVYTSDLDRVLLTTKTILKYQPIESEDQLKVMPILREKDPGIFAGKPRIGLKNERAKTKAPRDHRPKDGESWNDVKARTIKFLIDDIIKRQCGTNNHSSSSQNNNNNSPGSKFEMTDDGTLILYKFPLISTSGGVIKEFINAHVSPYIFHSDYPNCAKNCSIYTFNVNIPDVNDLTDYKVEMVLENHVAHY